MRDPTVVGGAILEADVCDLHLERMDRDAHRLGRSRAGETCSFSFESPAYVKAKMLAPK